MILLVLAGLVGLVAFLGLSTLGASESGEVVVVRTADAEGNDYETRLWVADYDGDAWIRAGDPASAWLANIARQPAIEVTRDGQTRSYTAVPTREATPAINDLLREKYGLADRWIDLLLGRDDAVAVRLVPR